MERGDRDLKDILSDLIDEKPTETYNRSKINLISIRIF